MNAWGAFAFDAAGPASQDIAQITLWLLIGATLIYAGVMLLLRHALRDRRRLRERALLAGAGVVFPAAVLLPLLLYSVARSPDLAAGRATDPLVIGVTARMWWWELRYRDPSTGRVVLAANELNIPVGRPVRLALTSDDVIHSVWVPALAGKVDAVPGRINHLALQADRPGVYRGQCAEFCGEQHARMGLLVIARAPQEFDRWLHRQGAGPVRRDDGADEALASQRARGQRAFLQAGCAACHRIAGLADSRLGPDLTHVGGRLTLGAGQLANDASTLRRWIEDVQALKPGARMPSFRHLDDATLVDLSVYLSGLE